MRLVATQLVGAIQKKSHVMPGGSFLLTHAQNTTNSAQSKHCRCAAEAAAREEKSPGRRRENEGGRVGRMCGVMIGGKAPADHENYISDGLPQRRCEDTGKACASQVASAGVEHQALHQPYRVPYSIRRPVLR